MRKTGLDLYRQAVEQSRADGTYKDERVITTPQSSRIDTTKAKGVLNMCANNYLGLSDNPEIIRAAKESYDVWGYGLSSVRFICGTQGIHKQLERKISEFLGMDDTILYSSCFDANGGLFETLLGPEDAVISDALNHASIIDGVRLCKAKRYRYQNNDMADLERCLQEAQAAGARVKLIATDGVFSMDGIVANLQGICDLGERYDALVMVDDSHAVGFMGAHGRGTPEHCGVMDRVDIITGTLGKALGGASGGYTSARQEIVDLLRQKSRPYLFSNTLAPSIACGALRTFEMLQQSTALRDRVHENTRYFREKIRSVGFDIVESDHPIVAVMLYDAKVATAFAARMLELGVYVVGFSYPVVPQGKARIRVQVSAVHTKEDLDFAVACFAQVKKEMGL
ncbi:MAG TPA: glycine C-acetyltransferase [Candidatus Onthenecus intestinigallinarum]|uniref:2-amino-3-ketobutyrate coenzyme A ligase n=1 Tax=Candidatus Onthenecus intestinigallinarum TaxID=2840875 RepID=A0A9D1CQS9_9FIRM|nr:glycine C-acetyltransferase [Candidatus Onthenecus intestinigallinarum]